MTKHQMLQDELQDKMEFFRWLIKDIETSVDDKEFEYKLEYFHWLAQDIESLNEQIEQLEGDDQHEEAV